MRISRILAALSAMLLVASTAIAQQAPPSASPRTANAANAERPGAPSPGSSGSSLNLSHGVAVIDIGFILERYSRVKMEQDSFKRDMERVDAALKKENDDITKASEKLKGYKPGSPEFKKLEEELTQRSSDLKVKIQLQQKEFTEREARVLLKAYQEIQAAVKVFAERNGISLVLQYSGAPVDQNNPRSVQAEVMKMVIYQNGLDISPIILDELNRRATVPGVASPPQRAPQRK